jgi:hypothetical protein
VDAILVRVFAGVAVAVTVGWLIAFVAMPIIRPDFQPPAEVAVAMTAVITAVAGLLGGSYYKARRALDEDQPEEVGSDGDGNGQ